MIYNNIIEYCERNEMNIYNFEKLCKLSNGTVSKWKDGETQPTLRTLNKIVNNTGIALKKWLA